MQVISGGCGTACFLSMVRFWSQVSHLLLSALAKLFFLCTFLCPCIHAVVVSGLIN
jgi:hypothetical protein